MKSQVIIISSISTGDIKLRIPQCSVRKDGTIWRLDEMPIIVTGDLPENEALKTKYQKLVSQKRFDEIDPAHMARLGETRDYLIEWLEDYNSRPEHPVQVAQENELKKIEANQIEIYLSSRGWGDYSPVRWIGDRRKPTAEILVECQSKLANSVDVDQPNQPDAVINAKIEEAKRKSLESDQRRDTTAAELAATEVPEDAVRAYQTCGGNPENFEDDIDDPRYWLVTRYAAAIEHQGLGGKATLSKLAGELCEAAREEAAQYQGEA